MRASVRYRHSRKERGAGDITIAWKNCTSETLFTNGSYGHSGTETSEAVHVPHWMPGEDHLHFLRSCNGRPACLHESAGMGPLPNHRNAIFLPRQSDLVAREWKPLSSTFSGTVYHDERDTFGKRGRPMYITDSTKTMNGKHLRVRRRQAIALPVWGGDNTV